MPGRIIRGNNTNSGRDDARYSLYLRLIGAKNSEHIDAVLESKIQKVAFGEADINREVNQKIARIRERFHWQIADVKYISEGTNCEKNEKMINEIDKTLNKHGTALKAVLHGCKFVLCDAVNPDKIINLFEICNRSEGYIHPETGRPDMSVIALPSNPDKSFIEKLLVDILLDSAMSRSFPILDGCLKSAQERREFNVFKCNFIANRIGGNFLDTYYGEVDLRNQQYVSFYSIARTASEIEDEIIEAYIELWTEFVDFLITGSENALTPLDYKWNDFDSIDLFLQKYFPRYWNLSKESLKTEIVERKQSKKYGLYALVMCRDRPKTIATRKSVAKDYFQTKYKQNMTRLVFVDDKSPYREQISKVISGDYFYILISIR